MYKFSIKIEHTATNIKLKMLARKLNILSTRKVAYMISNLIEHRLHPSVVEIINNFNINVLTFHEGIDESMRRGDLAGAHDISNSLFSVRAMYNKNLDMILLNETYLDSHLIDSLILHELIHSVGIDSRLDRETIRYYFDSESYRDTEEYIAQLGSYLLAKTLGLPNLDAHLQFFKEYVSWYQCAVVSKAIRLADEAIRYILDRKEVKKAA